jgi:crotonobetainyl-CoA:carnitine CoA-transferase CaiB-like acyl-CoA transferase
VSAAPEVTALSGIRVLDFTQVFMGPCATQLLGDYGAEIIKIERPGNGDLTRTSMPDRAGLDNPLFLAINRNKRSVALDVRSDEGRQVVHDLVKEVDVVVSNFRPGVMERLGFGYEALREINPQIIWAAGSGFGEAGPYVHKGGQDVIAQAYSGVMWRRSSDEVPLNIYPTTLCDYTTGMHLFQGVLLALFARERTGLGQRLTVAMYDSMLHMQMQEAAMQLNRGYEVNWATMPLTGVFETKDSALVMVGAFKENPLRDICLALELGEDLSLRPEFATQEAQFDHRPELQDVFRERLRTNTTDYWIERFEAHDVLCAPVRRLDETLDDEQTARNGMVVEMEHPLAGTVRVVNAPVHLESTPPRIAHPAPVLGRDGDDVLREFGFDEDRLARLREQGVLR